MLLDSQDISSAPSLSREFRRALWMFYKSQSPTDSCNQLKTPQPTINSKEKIIYRAIPNHSQKVHSHLADQNHNNTSKIEFPKIQTPRIFPVSAKNFLNIP